jgi:hypothetical protein
MTQEKKTFTTPSSPKLKIQKSKSPLPKEKKKSWVSRVHVASPHWLSMILVFKFVDHHFCVTLVQSALIGVHNIMLRESIIGKP